MFRGMAHLFKGVDHNLWHRMLRPSGKVRGTESCRCLQRTEKADVVGTQTPVWQEDEAAGADT